MISGVASIDSSPYIQHPVLIPTSVLLNAPCPFSPSPYPTPHQLSSVCSLYLRVSYGGAWVAQSVERPTSAQVMISHSVSSSPVAGSVRTAQSLEPALDSVSPSLSAPPLLTLCLTLSLKNK